MTETAATVIEKLKNNYGIMASKRTISAWRKKANQELYGMGDNKSTIQRILDQRAEVRKYIIDNHVLVDIIKTKFDLMFFQEERIKTAKEYEKKSKKAIPWLSKDIELYLKIIESLIADLRTIGAMRGEDVTEKPTEIEAAIMILRERIKIEDVFPKVKNNDNDSNNN